MRSFPFCLCPYSQQTLCWLCRFKLSGKRTHVITDALKFCLVTLFLVLALTTISAAAEENDPDRPLGFTSPSGNISCYAEATPPALVCEISTTDWAPVVKNDCDELDSGKQLSMTTSSMPIPGWWCRGDTWLHAGIKPLPYGKDWQSGDFTCRSEPTGVTCRNTVGHGWSLSRRNVRLF